MIASVMGLAEGEIPLRVLTGAISLAVFGLGLELGIFQREGPGRNYGDPQGIQRIPRAGIPLKS